MTREEILYKLKVILKYTVANSESLIDGISEESNLYTDLGLSSVAMLYMVIAIEEMFNIKFDDVNFEDFSKVSDVIDYVIKKTQ